MVRLTFQFSQFHQLHVVTIFYHTIHFCHTFSIHLWVHCSWSCILYVCGLLTFRRHLSDRIRLCMQGSLSATAFKALFMPQDINKDLIFFACYMNNIIYSSLILCSLFDFKCKLFYESTNICVKNHTVLWCLCDSVSCCYCHVFLTDRWDLKAFIITLNMYPF